MPRLGPQQKGVSLIEALVALAVMAFGTLGVLGMQASMRVNGDIAKQRSEAVRIAQETLETARAYVDMDAFRDDIVTTGDTAVAGYAEANASYLVQTQVVAPADEHDPQMKSVVVTVSWTDRSNQAQSVRLVSNVHAVPPALPGSLALPGGTGPVSSPGQRHFSIPREAVMQAGGQTSVFTPPGAGAVQWVFDNLTGDITNLCDPACVPYSARLLAGYVRFATIGSIAGPVPTGSDAAEPPGSPLSLPLPGIGITVTQVAPNLADRGGLMPACFAQNRAEGLSYYCAIPVGAIGAWSGRSMLVHPQIAITDMSDDPLQFRVCRYTTRLSDFTVPLQGANAEHPYDYVGVARALINQNFLLINAGDGTVQFACPTVESDPPTVVSLQARTYLHQPRPGS